MVAWLFTIVVLVGLVFGGLQITTACYVWIKHRKFGPGGIFLTIFGCILIGLSIWRSIQVDIGPKGTKVSITRSEIDFRKFEITRKEEELEIGITSKVRDQRVFDSKSEHLIDETKQTLTTH